MSRSRFYCFTLNNPTGHLTASDVTKCFIYKVEIGQSGTPHYQGYYEAINPISIKKLKEWNEHAHFEMRRGTRYEAIKYCLKDYLNEDGTVQDIHKEKLLCDFDLVHSFGYNCNKTIESFMNGFTKDGIKPIGILI